MRTRRAIVRLLVAAFVWALVASGCSSGGDEPSTGGDVTTTSLAPRATSEPEDAGPRAGGTLTMATFLAATALDPVVAPGGGAASGTEMAAIYDTLVRWNPTTGTYEPRTALAVEPSPDFTQWTIRLRPDVRFSDGTPYDAAAVKNGLDRHRAPANLTMSAAHMSRVADVALVDPLTVQVTLREPWPGFIAVLADEPGMIPSPTALAACGTSAPAACSFNTAPVGAGPFVVETFVPGQELVLRRNETYWAGPPLLERLRFISMQDSGGERTLAALDNGEADVAFLRDPATVVTAKSVGRAGHSVVIEAGSVTLMNNGAWVTCTAGEPAVHCAGRPDGQFRTTPPTSRADVRTAIAAAIEPIAIDREVTGGSGHATTALLSSAFTGLPPVPGPVHDVARAKALMDAVKAETGWDGRLRYRCTNTDANRARARVLREQLAAIGIELVLDVDGGTDEQVQALTVRDFDLACWGLQVTPDELGADSLRQNLYAMLGTNRSGYESAEMNAALDALRLATDPASKQAAFRQIATLYARDVPFVVDAAIEEYVAWDADVEGVTPGLGSVVHFDRAWLRSA